jgi:hypothetical protein
MSGIGIVRMGGDACERAAVRAYDTVALKPWMAGAATGPRAATGSHTSPATSTAGDRGADVTWESDRRVGVLQPVRRVAKSARLSPARHRPCLLSLCAMTVLRESGPVSNIAHSFPPRMSTLKAPTGCRENREHHCLL